MDKAEITVVWDAQEQRVHVKVPRDAFKTVDFALAVLDMAKRALEDTARMQKVAAMQAQAQEQQKIAAIRQSLKH